MMACTSALRVFADGVIVVCTPFAVRVKLAAGSMLWLVGSVTLPVLTALACDPARVTVTEKKPGRAPVPAVALKTLVLLEEAERIPWLAEFKLLMADCRV